MGSNMVWSPYILVSINKSLQKLMKLLACLSINTIKYFGGSWVILELFGGEMLHGELASTCTFCKAAFSLPPHLKD